MFDIDNEWLDLAHTKAGKTNTRLTPLLVEEPSDEDLVAQLKRARLGYLNQAKNAQGIARKRLLDRAAYISFQLHMGRV